MPLRPLALLLSALPLCAACSLGNQYRVYGTDLEARTDGRALLWPSTEDGARFRLVVERADEPAESIEVLSAGGQLRAAPPAWRASTRCSRP